MKNELPSKALEWTNVLLGVCMACCALYFRDTPAAAWNAVIVGVLVMSFSAVALSRYGVWAEWSNLSLGCWTLIAPFLLGFGVSGAPMWIHVVMGLCIAAIASIQLKGSSKGGRRSS
ncbi:SPW repeat protein [Rhizobium sp. CECT 9324]|uniref:SPW repeat protein n=1 Tax=Rhizobium sp. CECT 9324 TaxID=2845820 RepID=UPI001E5DE487|nr:SPW repeat protein [Rhizobium sp. CECT 9324]CAH0340873.1 hypothetical protein RHI9324_02555 [Rhizobium sp. CECT 9324]